LSEVEFYCPYDNLPCCRYDKDLDFGVCEATTQSGSDVCARFVLKPNVSRIEFFSREVLGEVVARRRHGFEGSAHV
jgi:hypothetical protein